MQEDLHEAWMRRLSMIRDHLTKTAQDRILKAQYRDKMRDRAKVQNRRSKQRKAQTLKTLRLLCAASEMQKL